MRIVIFSIFSSIMVLKTHLLITYMLGNGHFCQEKIILEKMIGEVEERLEFGFSIAIVEAISRLIGEL